MELCACTEAARIDGASVWPLTRPYAGSPPVQIHAMDLKIQGFEKRPIVVIRRRRLYAMMEVGRGCGVWALPGLGCGRQLCSDA